MGIVATVATGGAILPVIGSVVAGTVAGAAYNGAAYTMGKYLSGEEWNAREFGNALLDGAVDGYAIAGVTAGITGVAGWVKTGQGTAKYAKGGETIANNADDVVRTANEGGTDVNPQSPMFGEDWHRYFNETYGQENVTWESASIQDIIDMPSKITDFSPNQIANLAKANGWSVSPLGKGSLAGVPYEQGGGLSMHAPNGGSEYIQYHPRGGHHGKLPYFKISSGPNGTVRFFIGGNGQ